METKGPKPTGQHGTAPAEPRRRAERDENAALYVMSVAAQLAGLHPQTLRLYERKGLLEPARSEGGNRRYSERDLARMRRIGELTAVGINLEGVRRILILEDENAALRAELARWGGGAVIADGGVSIDGGGSSPPPVARR